MTTAVAIDLRALPAAEQAAALARAVLPLPEGGVLELSAGHDLAELQTRFQQEWPGQFAWEMLESGPLQWRARLQRKPAGRSCCGCCGGR